MLCQKCKKNEATVYYKQNINGKVTEVALCSDCAAANGMDMSGMMYDPFSFAGLNLFGGLFGAATRRISDGGRKVCPLCGSTLSDIASSGKVGCAKCYETFRSELEPTIARIHGRVKHAGRAPKEFKVKNEIQNKLEKLNEELRAAIEKQEFEEAAKLRDEIKKLQPGA